jgi:hypothetical protein
MGWQGYVTATAGCYVELAFIPNQPSPADCNCHFALNLLACSSSSSIRSGIDRFCLALRETMFAAKPADDVQQQRRLRGI